MKIYIVKHKGANNWVNFIGLTRTQKYQDKAIYSGNFFFKKKDAKLFLHSYTEYKEFYEIVALELPKTNQDNRFNNGNKNYQFKQESTTEVCRIQTRKA